MHGVYINKNDDFMLRCSIYGGCHVAPRHMSSCWLFYNARGGKGAAIFFDNGIALGNICRKIRRTWYITVSDNPLINNIERTIHMCDILCLGIICTNCYL